jgi:hypothetical protein
MTIHVCFKYISQIFHLFHTDVASRLPGRCKSGSRCCTYMHIASICFKCFRCFIRMFASVSSGCCICLKRFQMFFRRCVSDACLKCFICPFFMLQLLHLDVSNVDLVFHMGCAWKEAGCVGRPELHG